MKDDFNTYELIDQYFLGQLSGEGLLSFEARLRNDPDFASQVQLQKAANDTVLHHELIELKAQMDADFQGQGFKEKGGNKKGWWALALIPLAMGVFVLFQKESTKTTEPEPSTTLEPDVPYTPPQVAKEFGVLDTTNALLNAKKITITSHDVPALPPSRVIEESLEVSEALPIEVAQAKDTATAMVDPRGEKPEPMKTQEPVPANKTTVTDPCAIAAPQLELTVTPAHYDAEDGKVEIHHLIAGEHPSPLSFALVDFADYSESSYFDDLAPGVYQLVMKDGNDCVDTLQKIKVKQTKCLEGYERNYSHTYDRELRLPIVTDENVKLELFNKSMQSIITMELTSYDEEYWQPLDEDGNPIASGYYQWFIMYDNGDRCRASLTVTE